MVSQIFTFIVSFGNRLLSIASGIKIEGWLGIGGFIMSALALYEQFYKKTQVFGKLVSLSTASTSTFQYLDIDHQTLKKRELKGMMYLLKINFFVKNKDLNFKKIAIQIRYPNDSKLYDAYIIYSKDGFIFNNIGVFKAPSHFFLNFNSCLLVGKDNNYYLAFIVERETSNAAQSATFESLFISFINHKDKEVKMNELKFSDFDQRQALFEEEYWQCS